MDAPQAEVTTDQLAALLLGWQGQSPAAATPAHQAVLSAGGASAAVIASPRSVIIAFGAGDKALALAQAAVASAASAHPSADPGPSAGALATVSVDATRMLRVVETEHLDSDAALPAVAISAVVQATPQSLTLGINLPLGELSTLLSKVSWK